MSNFHLIDGMRYPDHELFNELARTFEQWGSQHQEFLQQLNNGHEILLANWEGDGATSYSTSHAYSQHLSNKHIEDFSKASSGLKHVGREVEIAAGMLKTAIALVGAALAVGILSLGVEAAAATLAVSAALTAEGVAVAALIGLFIGLKAANAIISSLFGIDGSALPPFIPIGFPGSPVPIIPFIPGSPPVPDPAPELPKPVPGSGGGGSGTGGSSSGGSGDGGSGGGGSGSGGSGSGGSGSGRAKVLAKQINRLLGLISAGLSPNELQTAYEQIITLIVQLSAIDPVQMYASLEQTRSVIYNAWIGSDHTAFNNAIATVNQEFFTGNELIDNSVPVGMGLDILGAMYNLEAATGGNIAPIANRVAQAVTSIYGAQHVEIRNTATASFTVQNVNGVEVLLIGVQ